MARSNTKHRVCSQESSVSSLLASCSLNDSSSFSPGSFRYKGKVYSSASQALQAYIEDFDLSRTHPGTSTGKINIDDGSTRGPQFSNSFENLDCEQHANRLFYRRETVNDMDSISLTTDDLLRLPADGSLPFACVRPGQRSNKKNKNYIERLGSSDIKRNPHFQVASTPIGKDYSLTPDVYTNINGKKCFRIPNPKLTNRNNKSVMESSLPFPDGSSFKDNSEHNPEKNYPRWFTSQKSDLNVSGITSIPDFKYPIWLHNGDLLPDANSQGVHDVYKEGEYARGCSYQAQRTSQLINKADGFEYAFEHSNSSKSFDEDKGKVNEYKCDSKHNQGECENALSSGQSQKPFSGDKIELLILKAKNLKPCTEELPKPVKKDDSPCSLDKLEAERSWENVPVTFKAPVPVSATDSPQEDSKAKCDDKEVVEDFLNSDSQSFTLSGGKHHGPVEALKQMLFNLQAVQESFNQNKTTEPKEESKQIAEDDFSELQLKESMIPITSSLHKALQHLSRLRKLVDDTSGKQSPK